MNTSQAMLLLRRAGTEHRRLVIGLVVMLVVNAVVYAFVVYPLAQRVANVAVRDRSAVQELTDARTDQAQASGTLTGTSKASAELATFYKDVLPHDLAGARRLTYLRLAQLARESNLEFQRASYAPVAEKSSTLTRLQIQMVLSGNYSDMRTFIYQLETAPEFVVIDNVQLAQGADASGELVVTLDLSTYYRDATS